jgi:hypothetical protein
MKKVRMPIAAVLLSVVLLISFRSSRQSVCVYSPQFIKVGASYLPVNGVEGVDYDCWFEPIYTCTYYRPNPVWQPNYYVACRSGYYYPIPKQ